MIGPKLDAALAYARHGLRVLPCHWLARNGRCSCGEADCDSPGKHPRTEHGLKDATSDSKQIEQWWKRWPQANIGMETSALLVLDVDPRNGGPQSLEMLLAKHGELALDGALIQDTGGGGQHYVFRVNGAKVASKANKLGAGLDIKSNAAYILVAPSRTQGAYAFRSWNIVDPPPLIDAPDWLIDLCKEKPDKPPPPRGTIATADATPEEIRDALFAIPSDGSYDEWKNVGIALNDELGDAGFDLWNEWSARGEKYPGEKKLRSHWRGFKPGGKTTIATVFGLAKKAGWKRKAKRVVKVDPSPPEAPFGTDEPADVSINDFYAYMPMHQYIYTPTCELWPASSVDGRVKPWPKTLVSKEDTNPSKWLDANKPVEQMTWQPGQAQIIKGKVMQLAGWVSHAASTVFNLYRPPAVIAGDANKAGLWLEHVHKVYPDDAEHIICWLAHRVQRPGEKINHAIVLSGEQGIGKDTLLEPVKAGVGPWNWQEISPAQMLGRFNGWAKGVIVRVSEARDMGEFDRFAFYDHCKVYTAAPPDVLRVDEKNLREHYVPNVMGVIVTTNHASDGLYLPAEDRRHFVARSSLNKDDFDDGYWTKIWAWYERGGIGHVVAYLQQLDLSGFSPKAPPRKTPAFWQMVVTSEAPESGELRDIIDGMGKPQAFAMHQLMAQARAMGLSDLADEFNDRKNRRSVPHKLERVGYVPVRNPDAESGMFVINGRRQAVYALRTPPFADQVRAVRKLI